ncbi:hypothetical protein [Stenotrophomonas sp. 24(2023)]|uniref:hypothetical protein n=1 Tax=Stenotrophomonas sp. 24(2023) TaxID=3068324 RepID=UPI0027E12279|nr:hypothetical protein [Stenotrophomonas sp. 24(2023)]WMJ70871.1 hypothetical protein Q9R17_07175 [Stenotrophomonas sp. 24(2023)]
MKKLHALLPMLAVPLSMVLAIAAMLGIQLLAPHLLTAGEYARFSTLWSIGQLLSVALFEWLRISTLRFSHTHGQCVPGYAIPLKRGYTRLAAGAIVLAALLLVLKDAFTLAMAAAACLFFATTKGCFDGQQAFFRAGEMNRNYALSWTASGATGLLLFTLVAHHYGDATLSITALAFSYAVSALVFGRMSHRMAPPPAGAPTEKLAAIFRYGTFISISSVATALFPALVRALALAWGNDADLAGNLLVIDLTQRILLAAGTVINIVILTKAIRLMDSRDVVASTHTQVLGTSLLLLPCIAGFLVVYPQIGELFPPPALKDAFLASAFPATVSAGLIALRIYAIDPLFVISKKTHLAIWGTLVSIATHVVVAWVLQDRWGPTADALLNVPLLVAACAGLVTSATLAQCTVGARLPAGSIALLCGFSAVLYGAASLVHADSALISLVARTAVGSIAYALLMALPGRNLMALLRRTPPPTAQH